MSKVSMISPSTSLINKELAERAHAGTSFSPERRGEQEIENYVKTIQEAYTELEPHAKTEEQKEFLDTEMQRFGAGLASKWNNKLAAHSRCISTMITGASKFPTGRAEKANASYDNRLRECQDYIDKAKAAIRRELKKMAIHEAGGEAALLTKKIENYEKIHECMKKANDIFRMKLSFEDTVKQLKEKICYSEEVARKIATPDYIGRVGFTWQLTNSNANLRRMRERLTMLQDKESRPTNNIATGPGWKIVDNAEMDRIQILHDEKPAQGIINAFKAEGWRWSPANKAWQRQRTENAIASAKRILKCE